MQETQVHAGLEGIDVVKIEEQLTAFWRESASGAGQETANSAITRACTLNLIVYTSAREDRESTSQLVEEINTQHPGRTIILIADRDSTVNSLDAFVSTRCRALSGALTGLCGEQITIEANGDAVDTAATAVTPLLIPDVPVFLWWKDVPDYSDKLWRYLVDFSDRVVVDSTAFDDIRGDFDSLDQLLAEHRHELILSDLNWGRLTEWRTLLASFWDVPSYREYLSQIDLVEIEFCKRIDESGGEFPPKALLIIGWLASRLNWDLKSLSSREPHGVTFEFGNDTRPLEVRFTTSEQTDRNHDSISGVWLRAGENRFSVSLNEELHRLKTEVLIGNSVVAGRTLSYKEKTDAERLATELSILSRDGTFEDCVPVVSRMVKLIGDVRR